MGAPHIYDISLLRVNSDAGISRITNFVSVNYSSTIAPCSSIIHGWSYRSVCVRSPKESSLTSFILLMSE